MATIWFSGVCDTLLARIVVWHEKYTDGTIYATRKYLTDVRSTQANWRREYNCERPHSSLDYKTPQEFRQKTGYADVESKLRFPHPHSLDDGDENRISMPNQNRETPVMNG